MELIWSGPARRDLFSIADDYGSIDPLLAQTILERVITAPLQLCDFPNMGAPTRHPDVRKWMVHKTPFILFYTITSTRIEIRRVIHGASNWRDAP